MSLVTLRKDLFALGGGAPVRVAYEGIKRIGGFSLIFRTPAFGSGLQPSKLARLPAAGSEAWHQCFDDAHAILNEGLLAFGQRILIEDSHDWLKVRDTDLFWPQQSWWKIDIRSAARLADVKWTWELGRHRDLVVLARAAALAPEDEVWLQNLDRLLRWWFEANPLEGSINWYSNLEIALRLIAWDQVLSLTSARLPDRTLAVMAMHVTQMRRHLWRDLPYTLSSMRNNHMLGDALGLNVAESLLGRQSGMRARLIRHTWDSQLSRQVNPDGSMIEDSLSYHRFVLEMMCARYLAGDHTEVLREAIGRSSRYLSDLGALDGPLPQYGDWDEGRVLVSSTDPLDAGNSVALGLAIAGEPEGADWREKYDLLDWYLPESRPDQARPRTGPSAAGGGEIVTTKRGPFQVWLKCGSAPSHGHADLGHVSARYWDSWVLVDPGTGTYNGPIEVRNGFRTSTAHNVLRPMGLGQIEPHRAFRWMSRPDGRAGRVHEFTSATVLWGAHDAYLRRNRSPWPWRITRACVVTDTGIAVIDWREGGDYNYELTIPLATSCIVSEGHVAVGDHRLELKIPGTSRVAVGEEDPFLGWFSPTYGSWEPAPWVVCSGSVHGPLVWSLGEMEWEVAGDSVTVSGVSLSMRWSGSAVDLILDGDGQHVQDSVGVGRRA